MSNYDPIGRLPYSNPVQQQAASMHELAGRLSDTERAAMSAALATYAPWVQPSFANSFFADPANPLQFYRDPVGRVYLEGIVRRLLDTSTGPVTIFTLPVGYRPVVPLSPTSSIDDDRYVHAIQAGGGTQGNVVAEITTAGVVQLPYGNGNHQVGEDWGYTFSQKWQWRAVVPVPFT